MIMRLGHDQDKLLPVIPIYRCCKLKHREPAGTEDSKVMTAISA